jgi:hypothetical protein
MFHTRSLGYQEAWTGVPEWAWDTDGNVFFRDSALVNFTLAKDKWQ